jgi:hypothetical protein
MGHGAVSDAASPKRRILIGPARPLPARPPQPPPATRSIPDRPASPSWLRPGPEPTAAGPSRSSRMPGPGCSAAQRYVSCGLPSPVPRSCSGRRMTPAAGPRGLDAHPGASASPARRPEGPAWPIRLVARPACFHEAQLLRPADRCRAEAVALSLALARPLAASKSRTTLLITRQFLLPSYHPSYQLVLSRTSS